MMNKRGQGLSTNAIILIILGVAVLVMLIIGFIYVWQSLSTRIKQDNITNIVSSCQTSCSTDAGYDFCSKVNTLIDETSKEIKTTCYLLSTVPEFSKYQLGSCAQIDCKVQCGELKIDENSGVIADALPTEEHYVVTGAAHNLTSGKVCSILK